MLLRLFGGERAAVAELLALALAEIERDVLRIESATALRQAAALAEAAHSLKGACGSIGCSTVANIGDEMERAALAGRMPALAAVELRRAVDELAAQIAKFNVVD